MSFIINSVVYNPKTISNSPYLSTICKTLVHVNKDDNGHIVLDLDYTKEELSLYFKFIETGIILDDESQYMNLELFDFMGHDVYENNTKTLNRIILMSSYNSILRGLIEVDRKHLIVGALEGYLEGYKYIAHIMELDDRPITIITMKDPDFSTFIDKIKKYSNTGTLTLRCDTNNRIARVQFHCSNRVYNIVNINGSPAHTSSLCSTYVIYDNKCYRSLIPELVWYVRDEYLNFIYENNVTIVDNKLILNIDANISLYPVKEFSFKLGLNIKSNVNGPLIFKKDTNRAEILTTLIHYGRREALLE